MLLLLVAGRRPPGLYSGLLRGARLTDIFVVHDDLLVNLFGFIERSGRRDNPLLVLGLGWLYRLLGLVLLNLIAVWAYLAANEVAVGGGSLGLRRHNLGRAFVFTLVFYGDVVRDLWLFVGYFFWFAEFEFLFLRFLFGFYLPGVILVDFTAFKLARVLLDYLEVFRGWILAFEHHFVVLLGRHIAVVSAVVYQATVNCIFGDFRRFFLYLSLRGATLTLVAGFARILWNDSCGLDVLEKRSR